MNTRTLIETVVGLTVAIIVLATLLVPVVNDITDQSIAEYNNSAGTYARASGDETVEINYTWVDGVQTYTVNGNAVDVSSEIVWMCENKCLLAHSTNPKFIGDGLGRQDNVRTFNAVINGNTIDFILTTSSHSFSGTWTVDYCFYVAPTGDFKSIDVSDSTATVYINSSDDLYYANWTYTVDRWFSGHGTSVSENGVEKTATVTPHAIDGVTGAYSITLGATSDDLTYVTDNGGTEYTVHPYFYIVPAKVVGEKMNGGQAIASIIAIIPLIVIVAILMGAIGMVATRTRD